MNAVAGPSTGGPRSSSPTPIGATTSSSTSTFMVTTAPDWVPATRQAGRDSWPRASSSSASLTPSISWRLARRPSSAAARRRGERSDRFAEADAMANTSYPLLYQINTRVWLNELSRRLGRPAMLDDIADTELDHLA